MKRFLIAFVVSISLVFLAHWLLFDNAFTLDSMANALFVVGIAMFFIGLIIITDATKIFIIIKYSFQATLKRHSFEYKSYYDYAQQHQRDQILPYSIQVFTLSIIYVGASVILSFYYLANK